MKLLGDTLAFLPLFLLLIWAPTSKSQTDFDVRINASDPNVPNRGLVEVYYGGQWGTICAAGWDFEDAAVACRKALPAFAWVKYKGWQVNEGDVTSTVWLNNLQCTGHESNFDECPSDNKWTSQSCTGQAAAVYCDNKDTFSINADVKLFVFDSLGDWYAAFEGNAYMFLDGPRKFYSLCSSGWSDADAEVFCRQQGRYGLYKKYINSYFGMHDTSFVGTDEDVYSLAVNFECTGNETSLLDCPTQSVNSNDRCYDGRDAGVACLFREEPSNFTVRLVGSSEIMEGRVEVFYDGIWGSVGNPDEAFERSTNYGDVVCRMLNLGYAILVTPFNSAFGESDKPVLMTHVKCTGAEDSLAQCGLTLEFVDDVFGNMTRDDTAVVCSGEITDSKPIKMNVKTSDDTYAAKGFLVQFIDTRWFTLCNKQWSIENAQVACRELGYGPPVKAVEHTSKANPMGPIWTWYYKCKGDEERLDQCPLHSIMSRQECMHRDDVHIGCKYKHEQYEVRINPDLGTTTGGPVEIFNNGHWGSICTDTWDVKDAFVGCRQLGFQWVEEQGWQIDYGSLSGTKWLNEMGCSGKEETLDACPSDEFKFYKHDCSTTATVSCGFLNGYDTASAFLQDGMGDKEVVSEGTAYLQISPSERVAICDHSWTKTVADVFCRQMGMHSALRMVTGSYYGLHPASNGLFPIRKWNMEFQCDGSESSLADCVTFAKPESECPDGSDAGVVCLQREPITDFTIELVGGNSAAEGRVEVCYNGTCGSLGKDVHLENPFNFGDVVCRELNQGYATEVTSDGRFGSGKMPIRMNNIWCSGSEESLAQCGPHIDWLNSNDASLRDEVTGVKCSGPVADDRSPIRFSQLNKESGIVEIFHQNRFGTICNKGWTLANAQVVCRELGLGAPLEAQLGLDGFGGPIFLQDVNCEGTETSLDQCQHSGWSEHSCDHSMDVSVLCTKTGPPTNPPPKPTGGASHPFKSLAATLLVSSVTAVFMRVAL